MPVLHRFNRYVSKGFGSRFAAGFIGSSLVGYDRKACEEVVSAIADRFGSDEAFKSKTQAEKEDAIFRQALVEMAR